VYIVDTGVIVAATDRTDRHHQRYVAVLEAEPGPLVTIAMVSVECAYLIDRGLGPAVETTRYQAILDETLRVEDLIAQEWARIQETSPPTSTCRSAAPIPASSRSAERLDQIRVATLDRRHFTVVRTTHCDAFELIP